jgi:uncharacterized protein (DUF1499 family)
MYDERKTSLVARLGVAVGLVSLLALAAAGPLHRQGVLGLTGAFGVLKWALYGAAATLVLSVIAIIVAARRRSGMSTAVTALVLALVAIGSLGALVWKAAGVPPIHDVTTDTEHPPQFVAVLPLRAGALNPVEYGGPNVAAQQHKSYADLAPLTLNVPPGRAFDRALTAARTMGWELVASDPAAGRIEATDTTFWFGFKDDIVIRVAAAPPSGSRVDVRSLSRVGGGDIGANAARIRKYLKALNAAS